MTAEIISVGTELLLGNILNTNAQYLSRELADLGITVQRESTIGDNQGRLADFVNEAKARCDLLVFTGGLGPTADDLTKETVAACYGDTLAFDEEEWAKITSYFARTGRETTPNNRKQAMVPVHGRKIVNHHGTAPGAWFEQDGRCAVLMPGVPSEMKAMWTESIRPLLLERQNCTLHSITLRVLGGESNLEYQVRDLLNHANPTAIIMEVCTALWIVRLLFFPTAFAITTLTPSAIPIKKLRSKPTIGLFAPTAATARVLAFPVKFPTTATSEALKSCSRMPVAATGRAYFISLSQIEPCIISI